MDTNTHAAPLTASADLLRGWSAVEAAAGKSRWQLRRDIAAGKFPAPLELGENSVAWIQAEVDAWRASRPRRTYQAAA